MNSYQVITLLSIGYVVFTIDKKQKNFPVPMVLIIIGMCLSFIPFFSSVHVTKELIFDWFLPALLFISAYKLPFFHFRNNAGIITVLSTVGLLLSAFLLGIGLYLISSLFSPLSFLEAMLIASILTPTDPVSVVSILKQSSNDPMIGDIVEGESMVNDGTSIVLYTVLAAMYIEHTSFSFSSFFEDFMIVSIGGIAIGSMFGWLVSKAIHFTHERQYQVMLSIVLAYGSFYIAEHLGVSGVLASVSAGMMLSWEFGRTIKESDFRDYLDGFWEVIEPSILSILFLLIGIISLNHISFSDSGFVFIIFILSLFVRFLVLSGALKLSSRWRKKFNWKAIALITWSGIKGTMSVALLLSLEAETTGADSLISITFGAVLLSLIIQSIFISPLSKLVQNGQS